MGCQKYKVGAEWYRYLRDVIVNAAIEVHEAFPEADTRSHETQVDLQRAREIAYKWGRQLDTASAEFRESFYYAFPKHQGVHIPLPKFMVVNEDGWESQVGWHETLAPMMHTYNITIFKHIYGMMRVVEAVIGEYTHVYLGCMKGECCGKRHSYAEWKGEPHMAPYYNMVLDEIDFLRRKIVDRTGFRT